MLPRDTSLGGLSVMGASPLAMIPEGHDHEHEHIDSPPPSGGGRGTSDKDEEIDPFPTLELGEPLIPILQPTTSGRTPSETSGSARQVSFDIPNPPPGSGAAPSPSSVSGEDSDSASADDESGSETEREGADSESSPPIPPSGPGGREKPHSHVDTNVTNTSISEEEKPITSSVLTSSPISGSTPPSPTGLKRILSPLSPSSSSMSPRPAEENDPGRGRVKRKILSKGMKKIRSLLPSPSTPSGSGSGSFSGLGLGLGGEDGGGVRMERSRSEGEPSYGGPITASPDLRPSGSAKEDGDNGNQPDTSLGLDTGPRPDQDPTNPSNRLLTTPASSTSSPSPNVSTINLNSPLTLSRTPSTTSTPTPPNEQASSLIQNALNRSKNGSIPITSEKESFSNSSSTSNLPSLSYGKAPSGGATGGALAALGMKAAGAAMGNAGAEKAPADNGRGRGFLASRRDKEAKKAEPKKPAFAEDTLAAPGIVVSGSPGVSPTAAEHAPILESPVEKKPTPVQSSYASLKTGNTKDQKVKRSISPFFRSRRSSTGARGRSEVADGADSDRSGTSGRGRRRDSSPTVGALSDNGESDVDGGGRLAKAFSPAHSAFKGRKRGSQTSLQSGGDADADSSDDSDSSDPDADETETEYDDDKLSKVIYDEAGFAEDVFDDETEQNTFQNAVYFEGDAGGLGGRVPDGDDESVFDVFGEEVEQDVLGEGPNVVRPPPSMFAQSTMRRPATPPAQATSEDGENNKRRKSQRKVLELVTGRPEFGRNRCTIRLQHGDPDEALETSGKRSRSYVVLSDGSEESGYAVEWAIGTVARDGDELFLTTVMETDNKVDPKAAKDQDRQTKMKIQKERQTAALLLVRQVTGLLQRTRLNITVVCQAIHSKNARHMLLDLIDYLEPTMVIVGSRGLGKLKGILLGSTSHYLVQKSSVPVMVARRRLKRPLRKSDPSTLRHAPRVSLSAASIEKTASSKQEDEIIDAIDMDHEDEMERRNKERVANSASQV